MSDREQNQPFRRVDGVSLTARTRLEGQVEVLERSIETMDRAIAQLASSVRVPQGVSEAEAKQAEEATVKAEGAVFRLARSDRSVLTVLRAHANQRLKFRAALEARAKLLRLPRKVSGSELAAQIEREPLVYFQTREGWLAGLAAGLGVLATVGFALARGPHSPSSSVFMAVMVLGGLGADHWWFSRLSIVLTEQRLCVGRYEFELSSLARVSVVITQRVFRRRTRSLVITTKLGRSIELPITGVPSGLEAAIRSVGLDWNEERW